MADFIGTVKLKSTIDAIAVEYNHWRQRFLSERLLLVLKIGILCVFTFTFIDIYDVFFPLAEYAKLPQEIKTAGLFVDAGMLGSLVACFLLNRTSFGQCHPGIIFLCISWSLALTGQIAATANGFASRDSIAWTLLFLTQATFMPVRWTLHLISQLGILGYFFGVNSILGLEPLPIKNIPSIFSISFILYITWFCIICNFGVYLYDNLQAREFFAIKELERANQKLQITEAKYRSIFENAVEGIFQSTADGRYITANPALANILGYESPEEIISKYTDIEKQLYIDPKRRQEFVRLIGEYGTISDFESKVYRQDGTIVWILEKAYAVRDKNGDLLYYEGLIEDITKRKQAEEAVRVFLHAVSHDLRNPVLGNLMVLKNLLNSRIWEQEDFSSNSSNSNTSNTSNTFTNFSDSQSLLLIPASIIERMIKGNERQLNLINSLMEAHQSDVQGIFLQCQPLQLYDVVEGAIADLSPMLTQNQINLKNLVSVNLLRVKGDATQLSRVFSNLIVNAVKHNPPNLEVVINARQQEEWIYCTVVDNGIGMNQQQSDRLFELYFRGDNIRHSVSLGLGLYLCKQIISAHGGEIGVKTSPGCGSTFWFTLPIHK
jgi:PAS domain S-box-containing protein